LNRIDDLKNPARVGFVFAWGVGIGQKIQIDPSFNIESRSSANNRILQDGSDLIKLSYKESDNSGSEPSDIPAEQYDVYSSD
jgi:hypothetical protein